ncbi:MAG: zinc-ribbon domain-containing protein [Rickettsiaceae bacterium]|jgi:predicted Zn finger-like uncharacterized protein
MYIACPKCDTKFVVNSEQIGIHGRKVKCSKCSHIWHKRFDKDLQIEPILEPLPLKTTPLEKGVNLPALLPIKIPAYPFSTPILLIGMIIFMTITLFQDSFGLKSILNNKDLSIRDLQITNNKELGKIIVNYKIFNSSTKNIKIPLVRIRLFDKDNRVINARIDDHSNIHLSPLQNITINTEVPIPPSTENIDIMLGNKLDFILR